MIIFNAKDFDVIGFDIANIQPGGRCWKRIPAAHKVGEITAAADDPLCTENQAVTLLFEIDRCVVEGNFPAGNSNPFVELSEAVNFAVAQAWTILIIFSKDRVIQVCFDAKFQLLILDY